MKFYIHRDSYAKDNWWKSFNESLKRRGYNFKNINLVKWDNFNQVGSGDWLLARFGHDPTEKRQIQSKYKTFYQVWNGNIFPTEEAYHYYDDKWLEYQFLKDQDIPTLITKQVNSKLDILDFLLENDLSFPVVTKKRHGAGSEFVDKWDNLSQVKGDIFPCLVQPYIKSEYDIRLFITYDIFFSKKRIHKKTGEFPYGDKWYNVDSYKVDDTLNYFSSDFIKKLHKVFVVENNIPTVAFDFVFGNDNSPILLEFSYCFAHKALVRCNHFYELDGFEKKVFYKGSQFIGNEINMDVKDLKRAVTDKVIEWIENERI